MKYYPNPKFSSWKEEDEYWKTHSPLDEGYKEVKMPRDVEPRNYGQYQAIHPLRKAGECCLAHLEVTSDSTHRIFVMIECQGCDQAIFCRKLASVFEKELSLRELVKQL